ncbi:MAG: DUF732 domain-containing protein, partial [Mycobacterium sp.]
VSRWRSSRPCGGTDAPTAVFGAHGTCAFLAAGHDAEDAVEKGMANNASKTRADEIAYVDAAILAYCPRYMRLTGTLTSLSSQPDKARHPIGWRADLSGPSVLLDDAVRDRARRPLDTQRLAAREGFGLKREERSLRLVVAEFLFIDLELHGVPLVLYYQRPAGLALLRSVWEPRRSLRGQNSPMSPV